MTVYGGLSENTRTPTASEIECSNPLTPCLLPTNLAGDPPNLRQVVAHTTELGVRGKSRLLGGDVSWNLSIFRTLLRDDIFGIATSVSQGFFQNIGDTRRQGSRPASITAATRGRPTPTIALFRRPFGHPDRAVALESLSGRQRRYPSRARQSSAWHSRSPPQARWRLQDSAAMVRRCDVEPRQQLLLCGRRVQPARSDSRLYVVNLHTTTKPIPHFEVFASINNLFNRKYATWESLSDPTGIGAPGVPADGVTKWTRGRQSVF